MKIENKRVYYGKISNSKWPIYIAATEKGICFVGSLEESKKELEEWIKKVHPVDVLEEDWSKVANYATELEEYFRGERTKFDLPLDINGTLFQKKVWTELNKIPYGKTTTYGELADKIGHPRAFRAVGTAVGKNPLLIIVPCHRVIHKNGEISGYRGPIDMKIKLLSLEKSE